MSNLVDLDTLPLLDVWDGVVRARRVEGDRITLAIVELEPGGVVPDHHHEYEQLGMVIRGEMRFTVDGETRTVGPGGTWRVLSNRSHGAVAGPEGAVVIDVFSPIRSDWADRPVVVPTPKPRWPEA